MISKNFDFAVVRCLIQTTHRELLIEQAINRAKIDTVNLNSNRISRRELTRIVPVTVFTTRDVDLISGTPEMRRNFLDDALIYMGPKAANCVENYEKLLRHRSSLLRKIAFKSEPSDVETLGIFDESLANEGEILIKLRRALLSKISPIINTLYTDIAGIDNSVNINYASRTSSNLHDAILKSRMDDIKRGVTSVGPHRDDVIFSLNGMSARHEASQGEQRTLAFCLIMGLHYLLRDRLDEDPIVLLDDIFSELDQGRIDKVLQVACTAQVIVTTSSDDTVFSNVGQKLRIESGQLV